MPMPKPRKGEEQDAYMARCMHEMSQGEGRTNEQNVAACMEAWRNREKQVAPHKDESRDDFLGRCVASHKNDGMDDAKANEACAAIWADAQKREYADPGYRGDGKKRFPLDTTDEIRFAWHTIHKVTHYTEGQSQRIKTRISGAWKQKIDLVGPPSADDKAAMAVLRRQVAIAARAYAPDPDEGESHDDYIERCCNEMQDDNPDMEDDECEEACQLAWDENEDRGAAGGIMHKTHSSDVDGMEFVLSDATPDRFNDVVDPKGWDVQNFLKNPVALGFHDKTFVIGSWQNLKVSDADLRGHLRLAPKGTSPRIDEIRALVEAGILKAVSVGFKPIDDEPINVKDPWGGTRFLKHELVEASLVAVPANPNALSVAKSLNISPQTVRMVFGEHADKNTVRTRDFSAIRGEHADKKRGASEGPTGPTGTLPKAIGEHAEPKQPTERKDKPMLLSQRIQGAEKHLLGLQDQLDEHIGKIDDANPAEDQMVITEDLTAKIEAATRNLNNLKAIEQRNAASAIEPGDKKAVPATARPPVSFAFKERKLQPLDYLIRCAVIRCKSKADGVTIDDMRRKLYGDDEVTRVLTDMVLKAASAPALTTVPTWAQELVRTVWSDFMDVLLPSSVFPRLSAAGLALTFGANGRIIIPTRSLTPAVAGSFVGEGQPIPVRQAGFASQTLIPRKMAVITTWTREMGDYSTPAIEGLLRQAVMEDTAISLDAVLLDNNASTTIRPAGLRSYSSAITASAVAGNPFANFVADYKALYGGLLTATNGNVRSPVMICNPIQVLGIDMIQPPAAATSLFPFVEMTDGGRVLKAALIESSTVTPGQVLMLDAADFTTAGVDGMQMEISDTATLHFEDTSPQDITGGTPSPATPVKSMWQTDSLALRMIHRLSWVMRRPLVTWMSGVQWG